MSKILILIKTFSIYSCLKFSKIETEGIEKDGEHDFAIYIYPKYHADKRIWISIMNNGHCGIIYSDNINCPLPKIISKELNLFQLFKEIKIIKEFIGNQNEIKNDII